MAKGSIGTLEDLCLKVIGYKVSQMVTVLKLYQMEHDTKETSKMG